MKSLKRSWVLLLLAAFIISACGGKTPLQTELPTPQISVTSVPDVDTTVNGYLNAWKSLDYAAMYGLLSGQSEQEAVNLGWAHGALLTTFPGDTTMATLEQVRAFARGGSARIQR